MIHGEKIKLKSMEFDYFSKWVLENYVTYFYAANSKTKHAICVKIGEIAFAPLNFEISSTTYDNAIVDRETASSIKNVLSTKEEFMDAFQLALSIFL